MKRILICISIIFTILISGCGQQSVTIHKQGSYQFGNSQIKLTKEVRTLNVSIDSGTLQIYCWDKPDISVKTKHTVRDNKTVEQLQKLLENFKVDTRIEEGTCYIDVNYSGNIKNSKDVLSEIELTIPRRINSLEISQDQGDFILQDFFEGNINATLKAVNTEIKSLSGGLILHCVKGNVHLNSGKLAGGSQVKVDAGNLYIKTECQKKCDYSFETETGNIDLTFPKAAGLALDIYGTISHNQFTGSEGDINVKVSSKFGKISINAY